MAAAVVAVTPQFAMSAAPASAAPPLTMPVEFDLARYQPVNPERYRALAYADNGRGYFTAGRWTCQFGPTYRYVGCRGKPATAPPGTLGVAISGDQQGPWWVINRPDNRPTYRFAIPSGFRPPQLAVGKRITFGGTTCTAPRPDVVACRTGGRALILTPSWHKFFFPARDTAHSANPPARFLPPRLQYWNQLPATPPIPR
ncbi:hypothetical protein [Gordonia soli]|uniref:Uncharacterized protein n=1 Tax=Gordonia soli NBRC 108243 TaxID=1223545 RepID=M0QEA4_9ACTN|nr:hypothetical protein [Gordonia soli]GAC66890.1 hypothetical protein GS4_05_00990 [Gordonia soli NBRC 108243]